LRRKERQIMSPHPISAVLADVDGTLVTNNKVLTPRAIDAVARLRDRGIVFTICSGRPARGIRMLVEPLRLTMPMAALNGGVIVMPDLSVLDERALPDYVVPAILEVIEAHGLDVWIYSATNWYVRSSQAPRVDRETSTTQSEPSVVAALDSVLSGVVKIVGVSNDHDKVATCEAALQNLFGTQISAARSQPYYVLYIKALAAPFTVNTIPEATLNALADHGELSGLLPADGGTSEQVLAQFTAAGVDLQALAVRLQADGAASFVKSWHSLMAVIASKSAALAV
jgi:haloacid dehalogenase-like hydrolase/transaldolase/fructose-6-phosphate aldolase-like protein